MLCLILRSTRQNQDRKCAILLYSRFIQQVLLSSHFKCNIKYIIVVNPEEMMFPDQKAFIRSYLGRRKLETKAVWWPLFSVSNRIGEERGESLFPDMNGSHQISLPLYPKILSSSIHPEQNKKWVIPCWWASTLFSILKENLPRLSGPKL